MPTGEAHTELNWGAAAAGEGWLMASTAGGELGGGGGGGMFSHYPITLPLSPPTSWTGCSQHFAVFFVVLASVASLPHSYTKNNQLQNYQQSSLL